ncbi:MAG: PEP-CTERM sorting domain-containing protein [Phycisphaerales bacterium JB039]
MRGNLLIAAPTTLAVCAAAAAQSFTGLGNLGGSLPSSTGWAVTNGGAVVVGESFAPGAIEAFRWTPAGMQSLATMPGGGLSSLARGVSAAGAVVVGQSRDDGFVLEAVRWTESAGMEGLGFLPGHSVSIGAAVSGDGATIVGRSSVSTVAQAFRWTEASGMEGLGFLPGDVVSDARGVSGDGSVIVGTSGLGFSPTSARQACRWVDGVASGLGFLPGDNGSGALAVSADGATVVGGSFFIGGIGSHPFRWTEAGGMEYLGLGPQSSNCDALSVSGDGSIIVGTCYTASRAIACIWTAAEGIRPLEDVLVDEYGLSLSGWILIVAHGVSPAGDASSATGSTRAASRRRFLPCCRRCARPTATATEN